MELQFIGTTLIVIYFELNCLQFFIGGTTYKPNMAIFVGYEWLLPQFGYYNY